MGSGADYHTRNSTSHVRITELSRDFDRNNLVVGQGIDRLVSNVVREGFTFDPRTGNDDANAILAENWRHWSGNADLCDLAGEATFNEQVEQVLRAGVVDGDIFPMFTDVGAVELVESHRIRTPGTARVDRSDNQSLVHGVLIDNNRKHLEYWMTKQDINPLSALKVGGVQKVPVRDSAGNRNVQQFTWKKRPSQTRGVSRLAPIADLLGMHDDLQFAKLVQAQVASFYTIFKEQPEGGFGHAVGDLSGKTTETGSDGVQRTLEPMGPGMVIEGRRGEKLQGFSPNTPNAEFFPHANMLLTFVAVNLNLPVAVLMLDPSNTNFSGWRGAMDQARLGFQTIQRRLVDKYVQPAYMWKLRQWIGESPKLARIAQRPEVNIANHVWHPPTWPYIEPVKDVTADVLKVANPLSSLRRVLSARSMDWDVVFPEIVEDRVKLIRLAIEQADELNEAHPEAGVSWRDLAPLPTAQGINITAESPIGTPHDEKEAPNGGKQPTDD
jgi:capsid protein